MSMKRPIALTTPVVTELVKVPSGLPIATASCPTPSADELPSTTAGSGSSAPSICTMARSVSVSRP